MPNAITLSLIPVVDMSTTDETVKAVKAASNAETKYGNASQGAEYVKFVGLSKLGWTFAAAKDEGVVVASEGHYSKGVLVAGVFEYIATGKVPEFFDTDTRNRRENFETAVELVKAYWQANATEVRERGGDHPSLTESSIAVTGEDGDKRRQAVSDLYGVLGGVSLAYNIAKGTKVHPTAVVENDDDEGEQDDEQGSGDDEVDPVAHLQAMATTMRQYADKHGVKHGDVLAIVTAAFK